LFWHKIEYEDFLYLNFSIQNILIRLDQGLKNVTERNETVLSVFFQKWNETKRKIFEKMRNEKKRNEIQRNETETKK
jgi:hypothetical protein